MVVHVESARRMGMFMELAAGKYRRLRLEGPVVPPKQDAHLVRVGYALALGLHRDVTEQVASELGRRPCTSIRQENNFEALEVAVGMAYAETSGLDQTSVANERALRMVTAKNEGGESIATG
ncbi:hypothetical protein C8F01DRAFT_1231158 [Mycena amicta]|nr:hypothetical protein C8F01DRAFT_1231158 [Mycena amicta]